MRSGLFLGGSHVLLLSIMLLLLSLSLLAFLPSSLFARESENEDDTAVCWVSSNSTAKESDRWGPADFFAVDLYYVQEQFGPDASFEVKDEKNDPSRSETVADYIDSMFAVTQADSLLTGRSSESWNGCAYSKCPRPKSILKYIELGLPRNDSVYHYYDNLVKEELSPFYNNFYYRQVSRNYNEEDRVNKFKASWVDPWAPQGGGSFDVEAEKRRRSTYESAMMAGLHTVPSLGHREHTTTGTLPVTEYTSTGNMSCSVGLPPQCGATVTTTPRTVSANMTSLTVDQNVSEKFVPDFVDKNHFYTTATGVQREVKIEAIEHMRAYPKTDSMEFGVSGDYSTRIASDGVDNSIEVYIGLSEEFRTDERVRKSLNGKWEVSRAFGSSPYTHRAYGMHGWARERSGIDKWSEDALGCPTVWDNPGPFAEASCNTLEYYSSDYIGYRQPVIGDVMFYPLKPTGYELDHGNSAAYQPSPGLDSDPGRVWENLNDDMSILPKRFSFDTGWNDMEELSALAHPQDFPNIGYFYDNTAVTEKDAWNDSLWRRVRWPVNFEDLNWYLFSLPNKESFGLGNTDEDDPTAFWLTKEGRHRLLAGGYTYYAEPFDDFMPSGCGFHVEDDEDVLGGEPSLENATCLTNAHVFVGSSGGSDWEGDALRQGRTSVGGFAPFDIAGAGMGVQPNTLDDFFQRSVGEGTPTPPVVAVRAGVASPQGAKGYSGGDSARDLSSFSFTIDERSSAQYSALEGGANDLIRLGFPSRPAASALAGSGSPFFDLFLSDWPTNPIDPSKVHILVYTYYERYLERNARYGGEKPYVEYESSEKDGEVRVPRQYFRRVICRSYIYPLGYSAGEGILTSFWNGFTDKFRDIVGWIQSFYSFVRDAVLSFASIPRFFVEETVSVTCDGVEVAGDWVIDPSLKSSYDSAYVDSSGVVYGNVQLSDREEFQGACLAYASSQVQGNCSSLSSESDRSKCVRLPSLVIEVDGSTPDSGFARKFDVSEASYNVRGPEDDNHNLSSPHCFVGLEACPPPTPLPKSPPTYNYLATGKDDIHLKEGVLPLYKFTSRNKHTFLYDDAQITNYFYDWDFSQESVDPSEDYSRFSSGLTRLAFRISPAFNRDSLAEVSGYYISILPDNLTVHAGDSFRAENFHVPLSYNVREYDTDCDPASPTVLHAQVEGFAFGSLVREAEVPGQADHVLISSRLGGSRHQSRAVGDHISYPGGNSEFCVPVYIPLGDDKEQEDVLTMNALLSTYPIAPGYDYYIIVRAYQGNPTSDIVYGPPSDILLVRGHQAACALESGSSIQDSDPDLVLARLRTLYDCPDPVHIVEDPENLRVGLLPLVGGSICNDLFSATHAGLSYENAVVITVWRIMLVLSASLLFVLFMWQGLRMTYDTWLDPRPSTGFRELVPRFLLCIGLVAGSLYICKWALVLGGDLTCFVSQSLDVSFWGFFTSIFGPLLGAYASSLFAVLVGSNLSGVGATPIGLVTIFFIQFVLTIIFLFMLFFMGIMFLKITFAMLVRIAFLAVLTAFSPIAFAFYASDATEHWTKKWISMFLGALFQQVVVIVVIYIGVSLMKGFIIDNPGEWKAATGLFLGFFIGLMTLAAAERVPRLINPAGESLFSGFGQVAKMSLMAATAVAGGIAGAGTAIVGGGGAAGGALSVGGGPGSAGPGAAPAAGGAASGGAPGSSPSSGASGASGFSAPGGGAPPQGGGGSGGGLSGRFSGVFSRAHQGWSQGFRYGRSVAGTINDIHNGSIWTSDRRSRDESAEAIQRIGDSVRRNNRGPRNNRGTP